MSTLHPLTSQKLNAFARRRRLLLGVRAVCALVVTFLGLMTPLALLDRFIHLPDWLRVTLSSAVYAAVLAVAYFVIIRPLIGRHRRADMAQHFGAAYPTLGDDMVSAVELGNDNSDGRWDSPAFRELTQQRVAALVADVRVGPLLPWRLIAGWLAGAAGIAVLLVVLWVFPRLGFPRLLARAIAPRANLASVSDTVIRIMAPAKPDDTVPQGDPLAVVVELRGHRVEQAALRIHRGSESAVVVNMEPASEPYRFTAAVDVGREAVEFRVEAGGAVTRWYAVNAKPRPEAVGFTKTYTYPAYSKLKSSQVNEPSGDLNALEGSTALVWVYADQPIKQATLKLGEGDQSITMAMDAQPSKDAASHGKVFSATIPITANGSYQVHLIAADTGFENKFSPQYEIRAVPDLRPTAEITAPDKESRAMPDASVELRGVARDDISLASVVQVFRVNESAWQEIPLTKEAGAEFAVKRKWSLKELNLRSGDEVTTKLVATDLKGNTGESEPVRIAIGAAEPDGKQVDGPHIAETLKVLAAAEEEAQHATEARVKAAATDDKQAAKDAQELADRQAAIDKRVEEVRGEIKQDANEQDLTTRDGREAARDDDDATAMLKQNAPTAEAQLRNAETSKDAAGRKDAMDSAAQKQAKLAAALKTLAEHYEQAGAGQPDAKRAELRQAEGELGIKDPLDAQYGQLEKLSKMSAMTPEQLKPALESELPKNPVMQGELSRIAKDALADAQGKLDHAAADEKAIADSLKNPTPADASKQDPKNPAKPGDKSDATPKADASPPAPKSDSPPAAAPPDSSSPPGAASKEAAAKQPEIADKVKSAGDDIARAAEDAKRLDQADAAKALQDSADQSQAVAKDQIPQAEQALASKSAAEAQPAVKQAAEAIQQLSQKLAQASKSAANPRAPQQSQQDKQGQKGTPTSPPSGQPNPQNPPGQQSSPNQSPPGYASTPPPPGGGDKSGATGSQSTAAQPAEAASKWMAAALDHLDQASQSSDGTSAPAASQGDVSGTPPSDASSQPPGAAANPGTQQSQSSDPGTPGSSASSGTPGTPGNPSPPGSAPGGDPSQANSASASAAQGQGASSGASSSEAQASAAMQAAVEAQAQAMRDNRMSGGAGEGASDISTARGTGGGGSKVAGSHEGGNVPGKAGDRPAGGADWGRLSPQSARDLMESRRENIPAEYRDQVEAYFRTIAEKAAKAGKP